MSQAHDTFTASQPVNKAHDTVYYITGKCGVTLDVHLSRSAAIKEYITYYKRLGITAFLSMCHNGIRYPINPSGSAADYM